MAVKVERVLITPKLAESMLQQNYRGNRKININHVKELENEMINGRWVETNDMICIDDNNELINGQHRLTAIVNTGMTFYMFIGTGFPSKSFNAMDSGNLRRSFADQMKSLTDDPIKRNPAIMSYIRNIIQGELKIQESNKLSVQEMNELINEYYGSCLFVYDLRNSCHTNSSKSSASMYTACVCASINGVGKEQIFDFVKTYRNNNIDISKNYNYKIALDTDEIVLKQLSKEYALKTIMNPKMTHTLIKAKENSLIKKIIWCFVNNKKRLPTEDPYPITKEELKLFSEIQKIGRVGA